MRSVYLIQGNDGRYKIGIAKNPKKRLQQIQTGNSDKLNLVEVYQSEKASLIESVLHNQFSYARCEGEWFDLSIGEASQFLKRCKLIEESHCFLHDSDTYI